MRHRFLTADVFTDTAFGGNAVAVFPDARAIPQSQMQRVAREFNLSETVFVLPPEDPANTRALRIFTPAAEIPFAGHPTVGTAFVLAAIGDVALAGETTEIVFEEGVGPVPVAIHAANRQPVYSQLSVAQLPELGSEAPAAADIAAALSLDASDLLGGEHGAEGWSCGSPFLFVPLADRDAVGRMSVDPAAWDRAIADYPAIWAPATTRRTARSASSSNRASRWVGRASWRWNSTRPEARLPPSASAAPAYWSAKARWKSRIHKAWER